MSLLRGDDQVVRAVTVARSELVFVRHVLEASEGLGVIVAERDGNVLVVSPRSQQLALDSLLKDLANEVELRIRPLTPEEESMRHGG